MVSIPINYPGESGDFSDRDGMIENPTGIILSFAKQRGFHVWFF
jgi:hypothetical protein